MGGKENPIVGSLINGLGTNALAGNDVRKGLMINAALLAGSGGLSGLGSAATQVAGTGSALTGPAASTAANTAFMAPAGVNAGANAAMGASQAAGYTSAAVPSTIFSSPTAVNTAITPAVQRPLSLSMPGVEASSLYEPTFMDKVGQLGQYAQQNPVLTQMAMQTGQGLLQQQQPQLQSPGLMRGSPSQVAAPQYQVGIPKVSLI